MTPYPTTPLAVPDVVQVLNCALKPKPLFIAAHQALHDQKALSGVVMARAGAPHQLGLVLGTVAAMLLSTKSRQVAPEMALLQLSLSPFPDEGMRTWGRVQSLMHTRAIRRRCERVTGREGRQRGQGLWFDRR